MMPLERLIAANAHADPTTDRLVATRLLGYVAGLDFDGRSPRWTNPAYPDAAWGDACAYSTCMAAAWELVEWMVEHGSSFLLNWGEDDGLWECSWITGGVRYVGHADTAPLAICRAALFVVAADGRRGEGVGL